MVWDTHAFGANSDVVDAPLDEIEEQENNTTRQEVRVEDEDGLLGEDDMVYQNSSDDSMSEADINDKVCSMYGRLPSITVLINFIVTMANHGHHNHCTSLTCLPPPHLSINFCPHFHAHPCTSKS